MNWSPLTAYWMNDGGPSHGSGIVRAHLRVRDQVLMHNGFITLANSRAADECWSVTAITILLAAKLIDIFIPEAVDLLKNVHQGP